jgi:non-ribosomal peptide synthetase component E (peptide arylation enzyme)
LLGDRIFAAISPKPGEPVSLDEFIAFLEGRRVASYRFPDRLLVVRQIPRDAQILKQV